MLPKHGSYLKRVLKWSLLDPPGVSASEVEQKLTMCMSNMPLGMLMLMLLENLCAVGKKQPPWAQFPPSPLVSGQMRVGHRGFSVICSTWGTWLIKWLPGVAAIKDQVPWGCHLITKMVLCSFTKICRHQHSIQNKQDKESLSPLCFSPQPLHFSPAICLSCQIGKTRMSASQRTWETSQLHRAVRDGHSSSGNQQLNKQLYWCFFLCHYDLRAILQCILWAHFYSTCSTVTWVCI